MIESVQQVTTTSGGYSLLIQGGILVSILGAIFATGRWVGGIAKTVADLRNVIESVKDAMHEGLSDLGDRLTPLERDYWRRKGYDEGKADAAKIKNGQS